MVCSKISATECTKVLELFHTAHGRVCGPRAAEQMWEELSIRDQQRLGGDLETAYYKYNGTVGMWCYLRGVSQKRAIMDIAELIGCITTREYNRLLRKSGEVSDNPEEALQQAIAEGHLVLIDTPDNPREAFWNCKRIEIDWLKFDKLWLYFWNIARGAKAGNPIDRFTFGDTFECAYLTKLKFRLVNRKGFPVDLADKFISVGRGTQTLGLNRERIRIIETHSIEIAREYIG